LFIRFVTDEKRYTHFFEDDKLSLRTDRVAAQETQDLAHDYVRRGESAICRVARIFLGTKYQNGKNIPNYHELYQLSIKYNKRP
jgi:hypothetical protein